MGTANAYQGAAYCRKRNLLPKIPQRSFTVNLSQEPSSKIRSRKFPKSKPVIESNSDGRNIKLRAGGIRDIEFIVQALQLLNKWEEPFSPEFEHALAIALLHSALLLSTREAARLREGYIFFRVLEHRLQMLECHADTFPSGNKARR